LTRVSAAQEVDIDDRAAVATPIFLFLPSVAQALAGHNCDSLKKPKGLLATIMNLLPQSVKCPAPRWHSGAIANIHLFGSALNLHPHLHLVVPQGVFSVQHDGLVHFIECAAPTDEEVGQIALTVILRCSKCGGKRVLVAFIEDPPVIEKILSHLGLPTKPPPLAPARSPPQQEMDWGA
jgi:hypothetical protein